MRQNGSILTVMSALWLLFIGSIVSISKPLRGETGLFELAKFSVAGFELDIAYRFDALSSIVFIMVSLLALIIGHYSIRYLDGEERQNYFFTNLLALVLSVSSLILASNLVMLFIMWFLTSYFLNRLLLFYKNRPNAKSAAQKKLFISRIGDIAILIGVTMMYHAYGTTDLSTLLSPGVNSPNRLFQELIGFFLVMGALTKSAQVPFHAWLPETMETPTPVSALMHAGVINAGGFLVLRFSPILQNSVIAHGILIVIGAITAVYASLVMITQNNIKSKLAYSTIAQMGMMVFACGLGAYSFALFHIVAHSFYKSYSFLSTGYLVEESKKLSMKPYSVTLTTASLLLVFGILGIIFALNIKDGFYLGPATYGLVMILALLQNRLQIPAELKNKYVIHCITASIMATGVLVYTFIEAIIGGFLSGAVPHLAISSQIASINIIPIIFSYILFVLALYLSSKLTNPDSPLYKKLYIQLWNDNYVSPMAEKCLNRFSQQKS